MHYARLLSILGAALTGASLLLPWVTFPAQGAINGVRGDAWPVMILLGPVMLVAVVGDRREGHRLPWGVVVITLACAAVVFSVAKLADASRAAGTAGGSVGAGAWVMVVTALATLAASVATLSRRVG